MKDHISYAQARRLQRGSIEQAVGALDVRVREQQGAGAFRGPGPVFVGIGASLAAACSSVWVLRSRGIQAVIPEPDNQIGHRTRRGQCGGRPVTFDAEIYKTRNTVERSFNLFKQWRGLATRYDKLALTYRGGGVLRAITLWLKQLGDTP